MLHIYLYGIILITPYLPVIIQMRSTMNKTVIALSVISLFHCEVQASNIKADTFTKALHYHDKGAKFSDDQLKTLFLNEPDSNYSDLKNDNAWVLNDIAWQTAWSDFQAYYEVSNNQNNSNQLITREAGFTKAKPQSFTEQELNPNVNGATFSRRDNEAVRASVVKAQVDPDIFHKAYDIYAAESNRYSENIHTLVAKLALAVQILRDRSETIPQDQWKANGIRMDVLSRFMGNTYVLQNIWPSDREYLAQVLDSAIKVEVKPYAQNQNYLRTHFRLARLSSALRDRFGYFFNVPCSTNFEYVGSQHTNHQCFVDMTDRGLWSWYTSEYEKAIVPLPQHNYQQKGVLAHLFEIMMPIALVMDGLAAVEFFTSSSAAEFAAEEAWTEEELAASQESFLTNVCTAEIE